MIPDDQLGDEWARRYERRVDMELEDQNVKGEEDE